jgi:hypothetical protein
MDERVMEEEGKDRKRKGWELGKKRLIFGIVIFMFVIRNPKSQSDKTKNFFFKIQALMKDSWTIVLRLRQFSAFQ